MPVRHTVVNDPTEQIILRAKCDCQPNAARIVWEGTENK